MLNLDTLIGYKVDRASGENGSISFGRFPLEIGLSSNNPNHNIGLGLSHHLNPSISDSTGTVDPAVDDFDDATGAYAFYAYQYNEKSSFGIKYTSIEYTNEFLDSFGAEKLDGNNVAIFTKIEF